MEQEGFRQIADKTVEHIQNVHIGDAVLKDRFLKHSATSQLALLKEEEYQTGLNRIMEALERQKEADKRIIFRSDIHVKMFLGYKP